MSELPKVEALGIELRQTSGYAAPVNVQTGELTRHTALGELGFIGFWNVLDGKRLCVMRDAPRFNFLSDRLAISSLALLVGRSLSGNKSLSPVPVQGG